LDGFAGGGWGEEVRDLRGDSSVVCVGFPVRDCVRLGGEVGQTTATCTLRNLKKSIIKIPSSRIHPTKRRRNWCHIACVGSSVCSCVRLGGASCVGFV
jgi:hypothetical protein